MDPLFFVKKAIKQIDQLKLYIFVSDVLLNSPVKQSASKQYRKVLISNKKMSAKTKNRYQRLPTSDSQTLPSSNSSVPFHHHHHQQQQQQHHNHQSHYQHQHNDGSQSLPLTSSLQPPSLFGSQFQNQQQQQHPQQRLPKRFVELNFTRRIFIKS